MDLAYREPAIGGHDRRQGVGDQHAGHEQDEHRHQQQDRRRQVEEPAPLSSFGRRIGIPAAIEDIVQDEQEEQRGPSNLVRDIAEPPVGQAEQQQRRGEKIEA